MLTTGYLAVITKPTRVTNHSATLLDHIYSNSKSLNYTSGIVITDVADHFGTFYVSRKKTIITVSNYKYIRQMKAENFIHFKQILAATDISPVLWFTVAYNMELKHGVTQIVFTNCSEYRNVP